MTPRKSVELSLGEQVLELADRLRATFAAAVAAEGLTFTEGRLLRIALRCSEQAEITDALGLAPPNVSALLTKLERRGLVTRTSSRSDRRHRGVQVTADGVAALRRVFDRLDASSPLMTVLDLDERVVLEDIVTRLLAAPSGESAPG